MYVYGCLLNECRKACLKTFKFSIIIWHWYLAKFHIYIYYISVQSYCETFIVINESNFWKINILHNGIDIIYLKNSFLQLKYILYVTNTFQIQTII